MGDRDFLIDEPVRVRYCRGGEESVLDTFLSNGGDSHTISSKADREKTLNLAAYPMCKLLQYDFRLVHTYCSMIQHFGRCSVPY